MNAETFLPEAFKFRNITWQARTANDGDEHIVKNPSQSHDHIII